VFCQRISLYMLEVSNKSAIVMDRSATCAKTVEIKLQEMLKEVLSTISITVVNMEIVIDLVIKVTATIRTMVDGCRYHIKRITLIVTGTNAGKKFDGICNHYGKYGHRWSNCRARLSNMNNRID
jgi:hypothetical protein